jgi:hypothetical protein
MLPVNRFSALIRSAVSNCWCLVQPAVSVWLQLSSAKRWVRVVAAASTADKPAVTERFPLARGADAIARLGIRQVRGKIVVTI